MLRLFKRPLIKARAKDGRLEVDIRDVRKVREFRRLSDTCVYLRIGREV